MVRIEAPQEVWKRRRHDRRALRERRIRAAGEYIILGQNLVVKSAESGANRRSPGRKGIPRDSYARSEVLQRWIGKPRTANGDARIGDIAKVGNFPVHFGRYRGELVPEAQVYGEVFA